MVVRDSGVREQRRARPRLDPELRFSLHDASSTNAEEVESTESPASWMQVRVHLEQPSKSRFFVLGYPEYSFLSLLDGDTAFAEALAMLSQRLGARALSEHQARQLMDWAREQGLLLEPGSADLEAQGIQPKAWNPLFMKVPCGNPSTLLKAVYPYVSWLYTPPVFLGMLGVIVAAGFSSLGQLHALERGLSGIVSPTNWIWLFLAWAVLKIVHELAHALTCHHFDGEVRSAGVTLVLLTPIAYCDVNSSWSFSSRWQRMAVSASGMLAELFIAACCVFLWQRVTSPFVLQLLANVIFMASVSTLLFNANPLMRFDGYYLLADLVRIPNLYSLGNARVARVFKWAFTGTWPSANRWERTSHEWFVWLYGVMSCLWKAFVTVVLVVAALALLGDFAVPVLVAVALLGGGAWLRKASRSNAAHALLRSRTRLRAGLCLAIFGFAAWTLWAWCPVPFNGTAPCVVAFRDASNVHAGTAGFVEQVFVRSGDSVEAGQVMIQLASAELQAEIAEAQAELESARIEETIASESGLPATAKNARHKQAALREKLADLWDQEDGLRVCAPVAGYVLADQLDQIEGTYVRRGDMVVRIAEPSNKELHLSIRSEDQGLMLEKVNQPVQVRIGSRPLLSATLKQVAPVADVTLSEPSLSSLYGGPLAVRVSEDTKEALLTPRFDGKARLPAEYSEALLRGERGYVLLENSHRTFGKWLFLGGRDWLRQRWEILQQGS